MRTTIKAQHTNAGRMHVMHVGIGIGINVLREERAGVREREKSTATLCVIKDVFLFLLCVRARVFFLCVCISSFFAAFSLWFVLEFKLQFNADDRSPMFFIVIIASHFNATTHLLVNRIRDSIG